MPTTAERGPSRWARVQRSRWTVPATAVVLGLVGLAVQAARGALGSGLSDLVIMLVYAVVLVGFAGRSEVVRLLRGDHSDERADLIQIRALAAAGGVLAPVLVIGFLVELARGAADVGVWSGLCALAGVSYALALVLLARRS